LKLEKENNKNWMSILVLFLLAALASFVVAGCSGGGEEKTTGASEGGPPIAKQEQAQESRVKDVKDASQLYIDNCGACHGHDGSGTVGPSIKGTAFTVEQVKKQIETGTKSGQDVVMPGFKGGELSDGQINIIAGYVKDKLK